MCGTKKRRRLWLPIAAALLLTGCGYGFCGLPAELTAAEQTVYASEKETDKELGTHTEADRAVRSTAKARKVRLTAKDRLFYPMYVCRCFREGKEKETAGTHERTAC